MKIEEFVNKSVSKVGHAADMFWMVFVDESSVEYPLHLQCPFRISKGESIFITNEDIFDEYECMPDLLMKTNSLLGGKRVLSATMNSLKDLVINFEDGYVLQVFNNSRTDEDFEMWRFFERSKELRDHRPHLVVCSDHVENLE